MLVYAGDSLPQSPNNLSRLDRRIREKQILKKNSKLFHSAHNERQVSTQPEKKEDLLGTKKDAIAGWAAN